MVDYIADYLENIRYVLIIVNDNITNLYILRERRVFPAVKPGYLRDLVPDKAPDMGEDWDSIFADVEMCDNNLNILMYLLITCEGASCLA